MIDPNLVHLDKVWIEAFITIISIKYCMASSFSMYFLLLQYIVNFLVSNTKSITVFVAKILTSGSELDQIVYYVLIPWKMAAKYVQIIGQRGSRIGIFNMLWMLHHEVTSSSCPILQLVLAQLLPLASVKWVWLTAYHRMLL